MKKNWKFATMALIAGVSLFATSCSSDEDPVNNPGDGGEDTYVLDSDITENVTLETGKTYSNYSKSELSYSRVSCPCK
jgi:hypothetical protein